MGYSLEGLGMARPTFRHQRAISNIIINYWLHTRFTEYIAIPEPAINPEKGTSKVPDVGFYPLGAERPVVVIELSDSEYASTDFPPKLDSYKRTWQLMDYGFVELFHFDFYLNTATRYDFKDPMFWGGDAMTTKSAILRGDVANLLHDPR